MKLSEMIKRMVREPTPEEKRVRDAQKRGLRTKRTVFHFTLRKDDAR